jgi:hypothetical protein
MPAMTLLKWKPLANPEFRADLWRGPDLHRPDTLPAMLKKYQVLFTKYWPAGDVSRIYSSCRIHLPTWFADLGRKHEPDGL